MKEINGAKCYTPTTKVSDVQKITKKLWNFLYEDEICGEDPTLQQIAIHNRLFFISQRNFGVQTMKELDELLAIAGLEISNDTPIHQLIN